ncbi:Single Cache domain 2 [uncultured archaeon]|nr:Single Cache domain 2 [uncultured archaeon]
MNDALWLGAGIYLAGPVPYFSPEDREGLIAFVEDARDFALQNGKKSALVEFNNRSGRFVNASRYIFAYDFNTTNLALPMQPDLIGTSRLDIKDSNGVSFCRDFTAQAKDGSGLSYLLYPDPADNMTMKLKLDYVMKVDDTWFLGSGIYAK